MESHTPRACNMYPVCLFTLWTQILATLSPSRIKHWTSGVPECMCKVYYLCLWTVHKGRYSSVGIVKGRQWQRGFLAGRSRDFGFSTSYKSAVEANTFVPLVRWYQRFLPWDKATGACSSPLISTQMVWSYASLPHKFSRHSPQLVPQHTDGAFIYILSGWACLTSETTEQLWNIWSWGGVICVSVLKVETLAYFIRICNRTLYVCICVRVCVSARARMCVKEGSFLYKHFYVFQKLWLRLT